MIFPSAICCFEGTFNLQVKDGNWLYQAAPRRVAYALLRTPERGARKITYVANNNALGMDETSKWCNSFVLVPKVNGKVRLCLNLSRFSKAQIRPVHRGPTLNDIVLKLTGIICLTLINTSSGYNNLKLGERSSYLAMSIYQIQYI